MTQQNESDETSTRYDALRQEMVHTQIEARGIRDDRVLAALRRVPRQTGLQPLGQELESTYSRLS